MKNTDVTTPELTDAAVIQHTGKSWKQWTAHLDGQGGPEKGRRELVNHLVSEQKVDEWWATTIVIEYERAKGALEKDGKPKGYSICATKTISAPLEAVFAAWSDPKTLDRWLGPRTALEFRDGGKLENADGDRATIQRIRPKKDIRLAWERAQCAPGSQVEVMFADKGKGKTGITLNHTRIQARRDADWLRAGWGQAFDELKRLLEGS